MTNINKEKFIDEYMKKYFNYDNIKKQVLYLKRGKCLYQNEIDVLINEEYNKVRENAEICWQKCCKKELFSKKLEKLTKKEILEKLKEYAYYDEYDELCVNLEDMFKGGKK